MSTFCQSIEGFWLIVGAFLLSWIMSTCSMEHDFHLLSVQKKKYPHSTNYFTGQENPVYISFIWQFARFPAKPWSSLPQNNVDTKSFYGFWKTLYKFMGPIVITSLCLAMVLMTEAWHRLLYLFLSVMTEDSLDHGLDSMYAHVHTSTISTHHDSCGSSSWNGSC